MTNDRRKTKSFLLTIFNTTNDIFSTWAHAAPLTRATWQLELCPTTNKVHIQAFLEFKKGISLNDLRRVPVLLGAHIEVVKSPKYAQQYCSKEETRVDGPYQIGHPFIILKPKLAVIKDLIKKGDLDTIRESYFGIYLRSRRAILDEIAVCRKVEDKPEVRGIWISGSTGVGKTYTVRDLPGTIYIKPPNKWWDGYTNETVVLADDWDNHQSSWCSHYLKIWSDRYTFIAETKGGVIRPNYEYFIITSNLTIEEFTETYISVTRAAIRRRFECFNFDIGTEKDRFRSYLEERLLLRNMPLLPLT